MTHVVHPYVHRLGIIRDWKSRWFTADPKKYREYLRTDAAVRKFLAKRLRGMYVASIEIERNDKIYRIAVATSRPGLIIGRSGEGATKLKKDIDMLLRTLKLSDMPEIKIDIEEIRSPELSASIVGQMVVEGLEKRMPFRRVMKQTIEKVMANRDVKGVRIISSGRLGGAEMARAIAQDADGVVVGSALVSAVRDSLTKAGKPTSKTVKAVHNLVADIARGLRSQKH